MADYALVNEAREKLISQLPSSPRMGVVVTRCGNEDILHVNVDAVEIPKGLPEFVNDVRVKYIAVGGFGVREF